MKLDGISINIGVTIPEETVVRCCQILGMYLSDNPGDEINVEKRICDDGKECRIVYIAKEEKTGE